MPAFAQISKTSFAVVVKYCFIPSPVLCASKPGIWKQLFREPLSLSLTKNEKTTVDYFFNFCGFVACLLLHFIILRRQKPLFIVISLPTSLELIVPNYSVFFFLDIRTRVKCRTVLFNRFVIAESRLAWVEMAVGLPRGSRLPRALPSHKPFFCRAAP